MDELKPPAAGCKIHALIFGLAFPALMYFLFYAAFSWPLLTKFSTHYFCGDNDGYQNIWNIWWVHKAIVELHQSPWHTNYLHYPAGTSLIGHTLAPFDGFLATGLMLCGMKLNQAYNTIVIFSFVMTGLTMFWLARRISGSYIGALFAGAAFTFSQFHFAQAQNHLQVMTLEWLPLAVLAVYELLRKPSAWKAVAAAGAMWLVTLSDFHQAFFVMLAGTIYGLIVLVRLARNRFAGTDRYVLPIGLFIGLFCCTSGILFFTLMSQNRADPLLYAHDPVIWSTDLLDPIVPSAQWRFARLTRPIWSRSGGAEADFVWIEHSLYLGWAVLFLCGWAIVRRRKFKSVELRYWIALGIVFFVLALGPRLHVAGNVTRVPGVYPVLEEILPPLKMAGMPMRLMAMVYLAGAVLAAVAVRDVLQRRRGTWILLPLMLLWVVETLPKAQPTMVAEYPNWVKVLHDLPDGAVIDTTYQTNMFAHLYYATGHGKPVMEGYISRYPTSVDVARGKLRGLVDTQQFDVLHEQYGFRYLVIRGDEPLPFKLVYRQKEEGLRIYDLSQPEG